MSELHLMDILAARHGCFISDLNLSPRGVPGRRGYHRSEKRPGEKLR